MTEPRSSAEHESSSEQIETLIAGLVERWSEVGSAGVESLCTEYPQLAATLRARVAALERFGLLASSASETPERVGPYRILRSLGQGGMGIVYLAEQEAIGRQVALKVVRPDQLGFAESRARFQREIEAAARLEHPSIVPIFDFGVADGVPYYTMGYVEGRSLEDVLDSLRDRPLRELTGRHLLGQDRAADPRDTPSRSALDLENRSFSEACLVVVREVTFALEHAHRRGVVHRDVKPSNVMLTRDGHVRVLDFGLAVAEDSSRLTTTGTFVGSLPYLPPEVLREGNGAAGPNADVYSLGVTLYELLTLRLPHAGLHREAMIARILAGRFERPSRIHSQISSESDVVLAKAMDPDPARRYATAAEFGEDLDRLIHHRPIRAQRASLALRVRRFSRAHPAWTVGLTLGALLGTVVTASAVWIAVQERDRVLEERRLGEDLRKALASSETSRAKAQEAVAQLLQRNVVDRLRTVPGMQQLCKELLEDATRITTEWIEEGQTNREVRAQLTTNLVDLGFQYDQLGELEKAARCYGTAVTSLRALADESGGERGLRLQLSRALNDLGLLEYLETRYEDSAQHFGEACDVLRRCREEADAPELRELALQYASNHAQALVAAERFDEARPAMEETLATARALHEEEPANAARGRTLVGSVLNLLLFECDQGLFDEAETTLEETQELDLDSILARGDSDPEMRSFRGTLDSLRGRTYLGLGDAESALGFLEEAQTTFDQLVEQYPEGWQWPTDAVHVLRQRAAALDELGERETAKECRTEARSRAAALLTRFPEVPFVRELVDEVESSID